VLTRLLLPLLRQSGTEGDKSRIVSLSSLAHAFVFSNIDYDGLQVSLAEIVFNFVVGKLERLAQDRNILCSGPICTERSL